MAALDAAMAAFTGEVQNPTKRHTARVNNKDNPPRLLYEYKYADLADTLVAARPVLAKNGLWLSQPTEFVDGKFMMIRTNIRHAGGGVLDCGLYPVGPISDHKTMGGNLTYARRYAAGLALGLASEDEVVEQRDENPGDRRGWGGDDWRREMDSAPAPARNQAPVRNQAPARRGPPAGPPSGPPAGPALGTVPAADHGDGIEIVLTDEQRADEEKMLMDLDIAEDEAAALQMWTGKWKEHWIANASRDITMAMHEHVKAAVFRLRKRAVDTGRM